MVKRIHAVCVCCCSVQELKKINPYASIPVILAEFSSFVLEYLTGK